MDLARAVADRVGAVLLAPVEHRNHVDAEMKPQRYRRSSIADSRYPELTPCDNGEWVRFIDLPAHHEPTEGEIDKAFQEWREKEGAQTYLYYPFAVAYRLGAARATGRGKT